VIKMDFDSEWSDKEDLPTTHSESTSVIP